MDNKKIQEVKDDVAADKAVTSVVSSLKNILKFINNKQDFAKIVEALMNWMIKNKQQLGTVETDSNFKQVMSYLNRMQSDTTDKPGVGIKEKS